MARSILRIDSSARRTGSVSRDLTDKIVARLDPDRVVARDLAETPIPQLDDAWVATKGTAPKDLTPAQIEALEISDELVAELKAADIIVIGMPIYNFSIPAALKAWIDQVARAGVTFRYTADGPEGLLTGKRVIIPMASGGTVAESENDFATGYMRHILGFLGITDVTFVTADRLALDPEGTLEAAEAQVAALAA